VDFAVVPITAAIGGATLIVLSWVNRPRCSCAPPAGPRDPENKFRIVG
jgi:hypothetical protein